MRLTRIEVPFEVRAADAGDGGGGTIEGYGSVFGNVDSYRDVIAPGAFKASLEQHRAKGRMPAMLWQHDSDLPIGTWTEMDEDEHGLKVRGTLAETTLGRDVRVLAKMGAVTGLSIGFKTKEQTEDKTTGIRTLLAADLWEVSMVTFPANEDARVTAAKSAEFADMSERDIEAWLRDAGHTRGEAKAAVSRLMHLGAQRDAAQIRAAARVEAGIDRLLANLRS